MGAVAVKKARSRQVRSLSYQLSVISYQLSVISYQLPVISYQLSVISYQLSVISYSVFQSAEVQKLWVLGKRQEAKVKREEKYVYLTSLGNAISVISYWSLFTVY
ncbi:hypothetical protein MICAE_20021 [Microcystis aeruginosa PCC 9806]|uniref:Uncharacterized protein n=1 Tax=Microcystis aeruginosa PCC 9806 TaxID=1160282 RepID=I4GUT9_MICAE|nr:hypothetical protein MICAE_20021 [Microcystis aeruginosa PCC 9806]